MLICIMTSSSKMMEMSPADTMEIKLLDGILAAYTKSDTQSAWKKQTSGGGLHSQWCPSPRAHCSGDIWNAPLGFTHPG